MSDVGFDSDTEMEPGIHILPTGIYIYDEHGEIVSWDEAEFDNDRVLWLAAAKAMRCFYEDGPFALRRLLNKPIGPYDAIKWFTGDRKYASRPDSPEMVTADQSIEFAVRGFFAECAEAEAVEWDTKDRVFDITIYFFKQGRTFEYSKGRYSLKEGDDLVGEDGAMLEGEPPETEALIDKCVEFVEALNYGIGVLLDTYGSESTVYVEREGDFVVT